MPQIPAVWVEPRLKQFWGCTCWRLPVSCCICSKHGFHLVALVGPGRVFARNWKPCLELVLCSVGRQVLGVLSWSLYLCSPVEYLIAGGTYKCWVLDTGWWENVIASPGGGMLWEAFVGVVEVYSAVGKSDSGAFMIMRSGCTSNVVITKICHLTCSSCLSRISHMSWLI